MKRTVTLLGLLGALAGSLLISSHGVSSHGTSSRGATPPPQSAQQPAPRTGPVLMYGDSLMEQARPYVRSTDQIRAFGGTALCDWIDKMAAASVLEQPSVIVVEFVGNNLTPCMEGYETPKQVRGKYEADAAQLKERVDTPILWVEPPPFRERLPYVSDLYDSEPRFVDAGRAVLADGTYTDTLPCLPDEGWEQGCVNGHIRVRAPDGAHFATSGSGYSAGGRRFAEAIDDAVIDFREPGP